MNSEIIFHIGDGKPLTLEDGYGHESVASKQLSSYCIVGASVRGKLHEYNDTPRDDAFTAYSNGTWLVVAVADGAGSCPLSRYGASYCVNALCTNLFNAVARLQQLETPIPALTYHSLDRGKSGSEEFPPDIENPDSIVPEPSILKEAVDKAFRSTRRSLKRFAVKQKVELDELHSTLLGLILNTKTGDIGIGQIGDGLILGLNNEKKAIQLAEPPIADEPGASYFFTQNDWKQYFYSKHMTGEESAYFNTFYLMTDGVANDCQYGPPDDILRRWANDMDREIRLIPSLEITTERLRTYLGTYQAKGSFDDRTLVVIYKSDGDRIQ